MKIHKGDKVKIITGKDKGKEGVVSRVLSSGERIIVDGVNMYKKHIKRSAKFKEGGIVEVERPFNVSNVMLFCPKCGVPTRVGFKIEGGKKYRVCKKCKEIVKS